MAEVYVKSGALEVAKSELTPKSEFNFYFAFGFDLKNPKPGFNTQSADMVVADQLSQPQSIEGFELPDSAVLGVISLAKVTVLRKGGGTILNLRPDQLIWVVPTSKDESVLASYEELAALGPVADS